ncbi:efflux RND transporter permease subunit [Candidatus Palauibacter sp.]|uniref:efflux RND transporter permease subunit n=1 Tax=Candidatus Palauibacter sp. TaxID=3101350 RepID=UPI003B58DBED
MRRAIGWMARHGVAANLLMVSIILAGFVSLVNLPQETFPEISLDTIQIQVQYPGASPDEVEQAIVRRIEERISGIQGIDRVIGAASENAGVVLAELSLGTDQSRTLDEIKSAVDRITSFPIDAEEPEVVALSAESGVMDIAIFGDVPERTLKEIANRVKDDLTSLPTISLVRVSGVRRYEISIEVSKQSLRAHRLTLDEVAAAVRRGSLDLPGGSVETAREEILVHIRGQNYTRADFADIIVRANVDGSMLRLEDVADIRDGFEHADLINAYNGKQTAFVQVLRTGDERVLDIVEEVDRYLAEELAVSLPRGVDYSIWSSEAEYLQSRISLLIKNGRLGLILVLVALALFLDLRLAFWTAVGIFLSFAGVFAVMAVFDISINMMALFGFILAIGIVVDDAIVVGENIFAEREKGTPPLQAAIKGTRRVSVPVTFAVLTTVAAFTPLLIVPGSMGKFLYVIPAIVIAVLLLSLVEGLFILPYHLSHLPDPGTARRKGGLLGPVYRLQAIVQTQLRRFIEGPLERSVRFAVRRPGLAILGAVSSLLIVAGLVAGRHIRFSLLPVIEGEEVVAYIEMTEGTTSERTREVAGYIEREGYAAVAELELDTPEDEPPLVDAVFTSVGERPSMEGGPSMVTSASFIRSNIAEVSLRLSDPEVRSVPASELERVWRDRVGPVAGARELTFSSVLIDLGSPVQVELSHPDTAMLSAAVPEIAARLSRIAGVTEVRDDRGQGKRELELELKPAARTLGITLDDLARQVRGAFFGNEAFRLQRGRDEVRVYVRLPEVERNTLADLQDYRIRTPGGGEAPLSEVAELSFGIASSTINRIDGRRIVTVTADVDAAVITGQEANTALTSSILPDLQTRYPGLRYGFGGEQRQQTLAFEGLARGFGLALLAIYALLAIPFRSYLQPLVIMASIPLGFVGAAIGHMIMGLDLGMLSMFGIVGLSGVVVNDSLVLMDFINERHRSGLPMAEAIVQGAKARFRPIFLTSLTTFLGVSPIIMERSTQAQFLTPMAVSLGFGILFATVIIMIAVPALAMMNHTLTVRFKRAIGRGRRGESELGLAAGSFDAPPPVRT